MTNKTFRMYRDAGEAWVAWLRDPTHLQGHNMLHTRLPDGDTFCCLGGLCEVAVAAGAPVVRATDTSGRASTVHDEFGYPVSYDYTLYVLPPSVIDWAGITTNSEFADGSYANNPNLGGWSAAHTNDVLDKSFAEIADLIEQHAEFVDRPEEKS